jgi:hypothetical protein
MTIAAMAQSCRQPILDRAAEELLERDAASADDQGAAGFERGGEGVEPGQRLGGAAGLDLDGDDGLAGAQDEIDFAVALAPVEEIAGASGGGVGEMGADGRFDQAATELEAYTLEVAPAARTCSTRVVLPV